MSQSRGYDEVYGRWRADPIGWWEDAAQHVEWERRWDRAFDPDSGPYGRWFPGARLNTSVNCLDRHVAAGRGDHTALIWDSPVSGMRRRFTYAELLNSTARLAGALARLGVNRSDRVLIYMPMVPEAVMAMLACARLGAVHCVVFGGFAANQLAQRIANAQPKVIISASCGLEPGRVVDYKRLLDEAIVASGAPEPRCLILQRPMQRAALQEGRDCDFETALHAAAPHPPVYVEATDPLYILYTSGTTAAPKGLIRDNGGHAVALQLSMSLIYGLKPNDVMFTASDIGWVVGHSYIVYGPLLCGMTTVLYEGKPVGTPDAGALWRVCESYRANVLFTAPTALRAIKQQDPQGNQIAKHDLSSLGALFLAGERCDPATSEWIGSLLRRPVVDHWWQTETGWPITACLRGVGHQPTQVGAAGRACPGYDVVALDDHGTALAPGNTVGNLAVRLPLPPGCAPTLWGDDERFRRGYLSDFPGWYRSGDAGRVDESGDVWVMGRTDDVINVAGHRLSSASIEAAVATHPDVSECAVVAHTDAIKGHVPLAFVVLKVNTAGDPEERARDLCLRVREQVGAIASLRAVHVVPKLPKTRSGKILRAVLRKLADGEVPEVPATIEDVTVLEDIRQILR